MAKQKRRVNGRQLAIGKYKSCKAYAEAHGVKEATFSEWRIRWPHATPEEAMELGLENKARFKTGYKMSPEEAKRRASEFHEYTAPIVPGFYLFKMPRPDSHKPKY